MWLHFTGSLIFSWHVHSCSLYWKKLKRLAQPNSWALSQDFIGVSKQGEALFRQGHSQALVL